MNNPAGHFKIYDISILAMSLWHISLSINLTDCIKHNHMSIDFHFNKIILL